MVLVQEQAGGRDGLETEQRGGMGSMREQADGVLQQQAQQLQLQQGISDFFKHEYERLEAASFCVSASSPPPSILASSNIEDFDRVSFGCFMCVHLIVG